MECRALSCGKCIKSSSKSLKIKDFRETNPSGKESVKASRLVRARSRLLSKSEYYYQHNIQYIQYKQYTKCTIYYILVTNTSTFLAWKRESIKEENIKSQMLNSQSLVYNIAEAVTKGSPVSPENLHVLAH